ncbi:MAG TPA: GNAT family N-acetyltransferase [Holophaga sp.]|nr:GNAT family N-acetyltransferase [Holophaga sp.]
MLPVIRDARPADLEAVLAVDDLAATSPGRAAFIEQAILARTCLVMEDRGHILGYGVLEHSFFSNGFISMLYVAGSARRQGVGSALLQALAGRCTTRKLFTSTNTSNRAMQALLRQAGFTESGIVHNLDPGDPEVIYFKPGPRG